MSPEALQELLAERLSDCQVSVDGDGYQYQITVIGDVFEGLNTVKRQQHVYGALNDKITDGSVHAVTIKTYTKAQWAEQES
ncbi:BolA/IbaG family iron-sulfur metabolism protein [Bermanella marisrubri]|uniref:Predicted transcriptional regulator, BolA superfamily protein n=1 Tax=Bermanella marisrubri TaxID=207949 RepID=Q1MYN3_9GAMM|nr:BolA/IbaG family iron-sulfur metabolism protein [Bermanella marisrubri]EAT11083.1 predicted transcriptional regulator, BolA superfamily protein [Oceanobacter sp. RED65] [Bermanella marisrubri]QIZ83416.1 BolA/IbaG family iron-sulfur metabolism protein [Bermanella marisrubri]